MTDSESSPNVLATPKRAILTDQGLVIPPTPMLDHLGFGTGVNVWSWRKTVAGSPWAMKNVRKSPCPPFSKDHMHDMIEKEASILSETNHENIIGFRGMLKSVDGRKCLALEQCGTSLGDLVERRFDSPNPTPFPANQITKVVVSMAKALHYLHTEKKILHGDVKSYNVLIKGDFETVKLCDFGATYKLNDEGVSDGYLGTTVYNAPEVIEEEEDLPITAKAEIFSLGMVIWEMLSLQVPHANITNDTENSIADSSTLESSIMSDSIIASSLGTRLPPPVGLGSEYDVILKVYNACTEADPDDRPTAQVVIDMLNPS